MAKQTLRDRLAKAADGDSNRYIGELTGFNYETVRRYMAGKVEPPASFIVAICRTYGVSADWLLFGSQTRDGIRAAEAARALDRATDAISAARRALRGRPSR